MSKQLTKAEEQIMQVLWDLNEASVKEIIAVLPEPKPAYNTVSTIVRILENKEFVAHKPLGRGFMYYPIIDKETYSNQSLHKLMNGYFNGSFKSMVSFFVKENKMDVKELESILKEVNKKE
ncbi:MULTISPECIES: BlaI/MecI/CopY family transcriptional regulator [Polaribacter]|uniref:BlaI/MecI/CopY family transcriptional regulator n=1 Tax=Polaribacter marinaquae TaxID=1642819 RepID=A0ABZ2TQH8_9FLAO|nr:MULTISPECIES: BlaI/MecI/CopY family transcriptional regulator [unclassified Polaribacter]AQS93794.1 CopY family transcriptional repressor [Polaribacter sp. BM10]SHM79697.1 Predicted transcriptional regulator [Polaribacter sp. KT 15]